MNFKFSRQKPFGVLIEPKDKDNDKNIKNLDISSLRDLFKSEHLLILRGFDAFKNSEDFSSYCERWGRVSLWPFGKVLELKEQDEPKDHIFDNSYIPMHWDGMYRPEVPEYQFFYCVKAPLEGQGGRTTFSNTALVLNNISKETKMEWEKVIGTYHRKMEFYDSKTVSPLVTKHPHRDYQVIRYNEAHSIEKGDFINPPHITFKGIFNQNIEEFQSSVDQALYNPKNFYAHEWKSGDIVIADNHTLLHGRENFTSSSSRHLQRVQVESSPSHKNPGLESFK